MEFRSLDISGLLQIIPKRLADERGHFAEVFRQDRFEAEAGPVQFVQENRSFSIRRGTVRGLHFQRAPQAQGKLVQVLRGSIFDVAVDIRPGSPSFGRHTTVELSADNGYLLWIPPGFLHGFCTLEDETEVLYKVTAFYSAAHDAAVQWNDAALGIAWPVDAESVILSAKDAAAPRFAEVALALTGQTFRTV
jgi:dTDP-4-dehydrorhamnose 3,5-epimerase